MHPPLLSPWQLGLELIRWNRPAGWLLLLWPTLTALFLASWQTHGAWPSLHLCAVFVGGTILMRSAGCCVNDVADRHFDRHVKRTAQRPVTSGAVSVAQALGLAGVLALLALCLVLTTNAAAVAWAVPAVVVTCLYPFAKRWVAMPQAVLGVAFGLGMPMAFAAVQGGAMGQLWGDQTAAAWFDLATGRALWHSLLRMPLDMGILCLGNLAWVLAYDTQYAMVDRDDDIKIGMRTSAITLGRADVPFIMLCDGLFLGSWAWVLWPWVMRPVMWCVLVLAVAQVVWHGCLIAPRQRQGCFRAFGLNHYLGLTFFAGLLASQCLANVGMNL